MPIPSLFAGLINRSGPSIANVSGGPTIKSGAPQLPPVPRVAYASNTSPSPVSTTKQSGRVAAGGSSSTNAVGSSIQFTDTASASSDKTYALQAAGDLVSAQLTLTVTATGNTATVDILNAISRLIIYAPTIGPIITMTNGIMVNGGGNTLPAMYLLSQRFAEYGQLPATVKVTGATAVTASFNLAGFSLPASRGPYTLELVLNSNAGFSASTTALSVTYTFSFKTGTCPGGSRLRYLESTLPAQPTAGGSQDYGPIAVIQDVPLTEFFLYGLKTYADIATLQVIAAGNVISQNSSGAQINALANAQLTTNAPTGVLYPCLAFNTSITLGRATTFLATFASAPATSGVIAGYCWHD